MGRGRGLDRRRAPGPMRRQHKIRRCRVELRWCQVRSISRRGCAPSIGPASSPRSRERLVGGQRDPSRQHPADRGRRGHRLPGRLPRSGWPRFDCAERGTLQPRGPPGPGRVVVFMPPKPSPIGHLRQGEGATRSLLAARDDASSLLRPDGFRRYFDRLYGDLPSLDRKASCRSCSGTPEACTSISARRPRSFG